MRSAPRPDAVAFRAASGLVAAIALSFAGGCAERAEKSPAPAPSVIAPSASWSRDAAPLASAEADAAAPAPPSSADPTALADLLAAAPKRAASPTGEDGGTRIGKETGEPASEPPALAFAAASAAPSPKGRVGLGDPFLEPGMSSPAIERAARADLYWTLVHRCLGPDQKILPPDAVTLEFTIDADGAVATSTILATSKDPKHEDAAQCMRRELSASTFHVPARGMATRITMTVPSVD